MSSYLIPAYIVVNAKDVRAADDAASGFQNRANGLLKTEDGFLMLDETIPTIKLKEYELPASVLDLLEVSITTKD